MTTGVGLARARSSRHTSKPFLRGSVMSRMTRSGAVEMAFANPSSPSDAVTPSYPSSSRLSRRPSNIWGSSSITRMRFVTVGLSCMQREVEREGAAAPGLAVDAHEAAVAAHHVVDNREAEAGALRAGPGIGLNPEELREDLALEARRNADAAIAHADDAEAADTRNLDLDLAVLRRILHRIGDQILDRLHGGLGIDQHRHRAVEMRGDRELVVRELA